MTTILEHRDSDGICRLTQPELAARTGLCERTIRNQLRNLETRGWLEPIRASGKTVGLRTPAILAAYPATSAGARPSVESISTGGCGYASAPAESLPSDRLKGTNPSPTTGKNCRTIEEVTDGLEGTAAFSAVRRVVARRTGKELPDSEVRILLGWRKKVLAVGGSFDALLGKLHPKVTKPGAFVTVCAKKVVGSSAASVASPPTASNDPDWRMW